MKVRVVRLHASRPRTTEESHDGRAPASGVGAGDVQASCHEKREATYSLDMTRARASVSATPYPMITLYPPGDKARLLAKLALPPCSGSGRDTFVMAKGKVADMRYAMVT